MGQEIGSAGAVASGGVKKIGGEMLTKSYKNPQFDKFSHFE